MAVTPCFLKAFLTPLRTEDVAPYLLASFDNDRYLPYEPDAGLLCDVAAFCSRSCSP